MQQRETHRPWWAPGALAAGAAAVLIGAAVAGLALIAFLLTTGGGDSGESEAASILATATPPEAASILATATPPEGDGVVDRDTFTMNEVGGSGANGTATWTERGPTRSSSGVLYYHFGLYDVEIPTVGRPRTRVLLGTCAMQPFNTPLRGPFNTPLRGPGGPEGKEAQPLDHFRDGFHSIVVDEDGVVVSCGDIPAVSPDNGTTLEEPVAFVELAMVEWGDSGIAGDVVLWARHDGVGAAIVANVAPGWWYDLDIHSGSCADPGLKVAGLRGKPSPDEGVFAFESIVAATDLATLQDGNHHIDFHAPSDGLAIVACADIPEA